MSCFDFIIQLDVNCQLHLFVIVQIKFKLQEEIYNCISRYDIEMTALQVIYEVITESDTRSMKVTLARWGKSGFDLRGPKGCG